MLLSTGPRTGAVQTGCSGRPKRGNLESCGGKNVRARLGPPHLNWPEPVIFGQPERANGKRPKFPSQTFFRLITNACTLQVFEERLYW